MDKIKGMCCFTWLVQIIALPKADDSCIKTPKRKASKVCQHKRDDMRRERFLIHIIFKVSSINI